MALDTRQRMIQTAVRLFQRDGYHATGWRGLVDEAGTPWGSIHHHFPGGKEELGIAAIEAGSDAVAALVDSCFATGTDPAAAAERLFTASAERFAKTGGTSGCPIATVALETANSSPALNAAARHGFDRWEGQIADQLRAAGATKAGAADAALTVLTLLEGALLLSRVRGTDRPLRVAGRQARAAVDAALSGRATPRPG